MKKLIWISILAAFATSIAMPAADDDLAVVVNKANSTDSMTKSQLRKLVLGEQGSWPGGAKVTVVLSPPGSPERDGVLKSICRMSEDDYTQHQMHASFTGDSTGAPKVVNSGAGIRQMVANTPGAIGFLRVTDVNDSVKIVTVDGAVAGQPEYKIKTGK